ncbi:MAG: regulatory protein RecX [Porticoccaceae bacterium]
MNGGGDLRGTADVAGAAPIDPAQAMRAAAIRQLARREHSRVELLRKLSVDFATEPMLIARVLDQLAAEGLQSDARFAEALVASRIRRGQGPQRIRRELAERGVDAELVERALTAAEVDWCALALSVSTQKFGRKSAQDWPERARRARFLQYRGFGADEIQAILAGRTGAEDLDTL